MNEQTKTLLLDVMIDRVLELRKPVYGKLPFRIDIEQLETNPRIRGLMLQVLKGIVKSNPSIQAIAACPEGCRAFAPLLAHECKLPFILPVELDANENAPLGLYGSVAIPAHILVLQEYAKSPKPILRMMNALHAQRYQVVHIVTIFDTLESDITFNVPGSSNQLSYQPLLDMRNVLRALKADPTFFGIDAKLAHACYEHYEHKESRSIPPPPPPAPPSK